MYNVFVSHIKGSCLSIYVLTDWLRSLTCFFDRLWHPERSLPDLLHSATHCSSQPFNSLPSSHKPSHLSCLSFWAQHHVQKTITTPTFSPTELIPSQQHPPPTPDWPPIWPQTDTSAWVTGLDREGIGCKAGVKFRTRCTLSPCK